MKHEKEEIIEIEKATQVAYLSLKKLHVTPFIRENGRVSFRCKGNVTDVLAELQSNPQVRLLDYLNRLDTIRSLIYSLKHQNEYCHSKKV